MKKKIPLILLVLLLLIQLMPISTDNPVSEKSLALSSSTDPQVTDEVMTILKNACNDCHSNETTYPKYSRFQPVGWWLRGHIKGGRNKLNFSEWQNYTPMQKIKQAQDCIEVLDEKRMPLKSYTWMHPKGKLSEAETQKLVSFFKQMGQ